MAIINIRIDDDLKKEAEELCKELGLNMTTAVTIFFKKMCREQRLPFEVSMYNSDTVMAMDNTLKGIHLSKEFQSVNELFKNLEDENDSLSIRV